MPRDGSGNFTLPYPDFTAGSTIVSDEVDANNQHIADALTQSIAKDGQTIPTANLPMGGFRLTGLGAGLAATDSVHLSQVQNQAWMWAGTAGGTADALTLTPSPAVGAYGAGQAFRFIAASSNTGAATMAVSGLAAKAIQNGGNPLAANEIQSGKLYEIVYDGTQFQLGQVTAAPAFTGPASSADNAIVRWDGTDGLTLQNSGNGPFVSDEGTVLSHASNGAVLGGRPPSSLLPLPPNDDLDDVTGIGWYRAAGSTTSNIPTANDYFVLNCINQSAGGSSEAAQLAFQQFGDRVFRRRRSNGTWQSWIEIVTEDGGVTLAGGFDATEYDAGAQGGGGTFTPDPADGNFQKATNDGTHTLAPPGKTCSIVIQYTNTSGAGAVTTSGFTLVDGDTISTADGDDFLFYITEVNGFSYLNVKALQ